MAQTIGHKSEGLTLRRDNKFVAGVEELSFSGVNSAVIPITTYNSMAVENITSIPDFGSVDLSLVWNPNDPQHRGLEDDFRNQVLRSYSLATLGAEKHNLRGDEVLVDPSQVSVTIGTASLANNAADATITPGGIAGAGDILSTTQSSSGYAYVISEVDYTGDSVVYKVFNTNSDADKLDTVVNALTATSHYVIRPAFKETFNAVVTGFTTSYPAQGKQMKSVTLTISGGMTITRTPNITGLG